MLFDTPVYVVFLAAAVLLYWRLGRRAQNLFLLGASYAFCCWWDWRFAVLLLASTCVNYLLARRVGARDGNARNWLLAAAIAVNLIVLGFFKYFNFFVEALIAALGTLGIHGVHAAPLRILLPIGISFYTFQQIAYIVDVSRRRLPPSASFVNYALFVAFFPKLIAGPLQQPAYLLPQVEAPRAFAPDRFFDGIMLIALGLFRKCVIADNCALLANAAFDGALGEPTLWILLLGVYAFAWQVYGDFSGYSDMARGSAQLLGFHLSVNFRQPYLAWTLQEFWRRWHVTLSEWLRDYVFLPVSYRLSRRLPDRPLPGLPDDVVIYAGATLVTMLLGGLWHGANWTFVVWGGLLGLGLAVERIFWTAVSGRGRRNPLRKTHMPLTGAVPWLYRAVVFHFVCLTWVFFRATDVRHAARMLGGATSLVWRDGLGAAFAFLAALAGAMFVLDLVHEVRGEEYPFATRSVSTRLMVAAGLVLLVGVFAANDVRAFVYAQF